MKEKITPVCAGGGGLISVTKSRANSHVNTPTSKVSRSCPHANDVKLLKDTVSSLQADVLILKQTVHTNKQLHKEKMSSVWRSVDRIKADLEACSESVNSYVNSLVKKIDEIDPVIQTFEARLVSIEKKVADIDDFLGTPSTLVVTKCNVLDDIVNNGGDGTETLDVDTIVPNTGVVEADSDVAVDEINTENTIVVEDSNEPVLHNHPHVIDTFPVESAIELEGLLTFGNVNVPKRNGTVCTVAADTEISDFCLVLEVLKFVTYKNKLISPSATFTRLRMILETLLILDMIAIGFKQPLLLLISQVPVLTMVLMVQVYILSQCKVYRVIRRYY